MPTTTVTTTSSTAGATTTETATTTTTVPEGVPGCYDPTASKLVLRYWNCQGRGMLARYMAYDSGLDFTDEIVDGHSVFLGAPPGKKVLLSRIGSLDDSRGASTPLFLPARPDGCRQLGDQEVRAGVRRRFQSTSGGAAQGCLYQ
eukprot:COSAG01_NODE_3550_length_5949_cov_2.333846_12_plen_145_part_00